MSHRTAPTAVTVQVEPIRLRVDKVAELTGMSIREVWRKAADDLSDFPKPFRPSPRITYWLYADVKRWAESRSN